MPIIGDKISFLNIENDSFLNTFGEPKSFLNVSRSLDSGNSIVYGMIIITVCIIGISGYLTNARALSPYSGRRAALLLLFIFFLKRVMHCPSPFRLLDKCASLLNASMKNTARKLKRIRRLSPLSAIDSPHSPAASAERSRPLVNLVEQTLRYCSLITPELFWLLALLSDLTKGAKYIASESVESVKWIFANAGEGHPIFFSFFFFT